MGPRRPSPFSDHEHVGDDDTVFEQVGLDEVNLLASRDLSDADLEEVTAEPRSVRERTDPERTEARPRPPRHAWSQEATETLPPSPAEMAAELAAEVELIDPEPPPARGLGPLGLLLAMLVGVVIGLVLAFGLVAALGL